MTEHVRHTSPEDAPMSWLKNLFTFGGLFGRGAEPDPREQAVIVHFLFDDGTIDLEELYQLEEELENLLDKRIGLCDGHEVGGEPAEGTIFLYGPDARRLFETVAPALRRASFMRRPIVILRFGPAEDDSSPEEVIVI